MVNQNPYVFSDSLGLLSELADWLFQILSIRATAGREGKKFRGSCNPAEFQSTPFWPSWKLKEDRKCVPSFAGSALLIIVCYSKRHISADKATVLASSCIILGVKKEWG